MMSDFVWDKQKTYKLLIVHIELSFGLWNYSLKEYRDRQLKAKFLDMIVQTMEISAAEVERKFYNVRC